MEPRNTQVYNNFQEMKKNLVSLISLLLVSFTLSQLQAKNFSSSELFECQLSNLKVEKTACSAEKTFYVVINFGYQGASECFTVQGNGVKYGTFKYSDLPIKIGPLKGNCETEYEFVIRDCVSEKCSLTHQLGKVCCESSTCILSDLSIGKTECNAEGNFYASLKFNYKNTSDCFIVTGNGVKYGVYKYADLPVKIGPLKGDCKTNYEFVIFDCTNERCNVSGSLGVVCCEQGTECKLYDLEYSKSECDKNGEFIIKLKFKYQNTSDSFNVFDQSKKFLGRFAFAKQPIVVGPLKGDCTTKYILTVRDYKNEKCALEKEIGVVCCNSGSDCKLDGLKIEKTECNGEKQFYAILNFTSKNTSDCFTVQGNGVNYGTFPYSSLPIKIGPLKGDCETKYAFVIRDCKNEKCALEGLLGKVCCEGTGNSDCELANLKIVKTSCTADKIFFAYINFTHKNTSECFTLNGNGVHYGTFKYSQLPLKIGPLKGDCETNYQFVVRDCKNEKCAVDGTLGKVCCEGGTGGGKDCNISDLNVSRSECTEEGTFYVKLNFKYQNVSECFVVKQNDNTISKFPYSMLPLELGPFKGDCKTEYIFSVYDCKNEACAAKKALGKVCCENQSGDCKLSNLKMEKTECNDNLEFYLFFNFNHENTSDCFKVSGNGISYGTYKYADLPIKIGPLKGNCETEYEFVFRDCENEKCEIVKELGKVCCENQSGDCKLSNLKMEKTECNDNKEFYLYFNFSHQNTSDCFKVSGNGISYGTFKYTDLPIKIGPLKGDCETKYAFLFSDCENEKCSIAKDLGKVCCEAQGDCIIDDLIVKRTECNKEGLFYVKLNFVAKNSSECFVVRQNDNTIGKFKYSQLPLELGPFKGDCKTEYIFTVYDCENERCAAKTLLGKVCCENNNSDCKLSELKIEKSECAADKTFYVKLNFDHTNTSDCFIVTGNGVKYGSFMYSQLPIKIGPLKADCSTEYEFVVRDCENEKCTVSNNLGKVCCEGQNLCEIGGLEISKGDCNAEGLFNIKLNFKYKNVSECFVVRQNNNILGKFKYSQLPLQLGPFKGDCTTNYTFTISDCVSEKCFVKKEIGRVCCKPLTGSCKLSELKYEKTLCNENKEVYIVLKFAYQNTSECFTVTSNGKSLGTFNYKNLPVKVGPFKADCETKYGLVIRDCKSESCALEASLGTICCEKLGAACEITQLEVKALDCTGPAQYSVKINFHHTGTKGLGFDVFDRNGKSIGFYSYTSLPLTIKEYKASGSEYDYLKVCENDNEKCCAEIEFPALKCLKGTGTNFSVDQVELRYANDYIILYSETGFPLNFSYYITDITGKDHYLIELNKDKNRITLSTQGLFNGVYMIKMQNSYNLRNLKFVK